MIFLKLFWEFFKIGIFTIGGGYAMIPLIEDVAIKNEWLTPDAFLDLIGVCESTPGPISVNMATYIGANQFDGFFPKIIGSLSSLTGVVLPSFIIILIIAAVFQKMTKNRYYQSMSNGIKPIVIALVIATGIYFTLQITHLDTFKGVNYNIIVILLCVVLIDVLHLIIKKEQINSIILILISSGIGLVISLLMK